MIALEAVAARSAPLALASVSWTAGPGIHSLVGGKTDGGLLLLALIAGAARPRSGSVRVLGGRPTDEGVRGRIAFVPRNPVLPNGMTVAEVLAMAAAIRGEALRSAAERLNTLGAEALSARAVETLSRAELRAVAITEATTSSRVRVLLIEEPFVDLDPRAASHLPEVLRARSRDGCTVVVATASVRDAGEIADNHVLLRAGAIVCQATSLDALPRLGPCGARLRIVSSDPKLLASALVRENEVEAVAGRGATVIARGRDMVELARTAGRAILATGVDVLEIRVRPPSLDEARTGASEVAATRGRQEP